MIVIIGILILIAAVVVAVAGFVANGGSSHALGDSFGIFGQHVSGASTGQLFLGGVLVGVVGMLGLNMLLGVLNRRLASGGMRRQLKLAQREQEVLRTDRDRLTQKLAEERATHSHDVAHRVSEAAQTKDEA
ncbi:hypothetical protein GALL_437330 [mine drainage metagenome]|uniref:Lipopolysaccharide assembly protein A domain-containing protein n=1 Tax=mine drainage metagenome TaxID=410659 RepID=A0A1J5Q3Q1_9ZZZZ